MSLGRWTDRLRTRRTAVLMAYDAAALAGAYSLSVVLRYDGSVSADIASHSAVLIAFAILLQWVCALPGRLYQGRVGVATIDETVLLGLTTATAGLLVTFVNALSSPPWVGRSVPLTGTFLGLFFMVTARAMWRYRTDQIPFATSNARRTRTIVVGAGFLGARLVHSMLAQPGAGYVPVGFLDDDAWKRRRRHYGVPVLGSLADLERIVEETGAEAIVIAIPSATKDLIGPLSATARKLGVALKVLPSYSETLSDKTDIGDVRDVNMQDLLGRAAVETDISSIAGYVTGKRVLVTGAGGSIGSELCRQLARFGPAELMMLDRDESALHSVQLSIQGHGLLDGRNVVLADIRDEIALQRIFQDRRPEVVFHAAALKHLPLLEQYPHEAMKTNVLGTANVLRVAADVGVSTFVNISTDKAADPTSALGYSKRIAERLTASMTARASGTYISVRFGNVLGSRGSVLHAFTAQIAAGGPVTVTHPDITRYFMTVEEAVQLVIQAGAIGKDGGVMILDMGEPVKIVDMARQLIEMSSKDVEIVYTGLREGEKMHEQLFGASDVAARAQHPLISHSPVTPLSVDLVEAYSPDSSKAAMNEAFKDWVQLPSGTTQAIDETSSLNGRPLRVRG